MSPDEARTADAMRRAQDRTARLSAALVIVSVGLLTFTLEGMTGIRSEVSIPWWALAVGFAVAEVTVFHLEINREAHTFSLSEIPTVIGLLFAPPAALIVGRLVGEAVTLVLRDRQTVPKLAFNLSMFLGECTLALLFFHTLAGSAGLADTRTWLAAFGAVAAADTLSIVCVALAIRWHGAEPEPRKLLFVGAATAATNTSIAIAASLLLAANAAALVMIAVLVAIAFAAYRSFAALTQRYASLQLLYDFTTVVGRSMSAEDVLDKMLDQAQRLLRANTAEIVLAGDDGPVVRLLKRGETSASGEICGSEQGELLRAKVIEEGRALVVGRSCRDAELRAVADQLRVKDLIIAPLTGDGRVIGTIAVADRIGEVSTFDGEDGRLFETLANHASVALENGRLLDRLSREVREREHQALHDALTGLPNRVMLFRAVRQLVDDRRPSAEPFTVMLMDLDHFKEVNDTLGHHWGDLLLQEVARRLVAALPGGTTVARLGGDEFAFVLPGVANESAATLVASRVLAYLRQPCYLEDLTVEIGGSIGVAFWPEHGHDAPSLLKRADVAMYAAKGTQEHIAVYDASTDDSSPRRLALLSALREAVDGEALEVQYQPKIRLSDGVPVGVEALVRWRHPELGPISPDEFVPLAEHAGLIGPLTELVLARSLEECKRWEDQGVTLGVAVNLAVRSLIDERLPATVAALLDRTGVAPPRLTLEITETGIMTDPRRTVGTLHALAELGVRLSVDDFGTGYSSLSYLQRLPVHEVKIDRSFVMAIGVDRGDVTIVRSVIDLGRNLGLQVVAEGVEDELALQRLVTMGCDYAQGYHVSRPLPPEAVVPWAADRLARGPRSTAGALSH